MSYQQNSSRLRRLPDFFGITDSSGLMPLSQIRDNGIINNGPKQTVAEQEERSSILAKLKAPVETTNRTEKHAPKRSAEKEL